MDCEIIMGFLESLFSGAKVFLKQFVTVAAEAVQIVLDEIDKSIFGRAATQLVQGATKKYFSEASELANEERELANKFQRDGRRSNVDAERLKEISEERDHLRKELEIAKNRESAEELNSAKEYIKLAPINDDEASATVGILASKICPECGETMRIRQGGYNDKTERRSFYWQCTSVKFTCPTIKLDPTAENGSVIRKPDPNLDLSITQRREIWQQKDNLVKTASRLRQGLGEDDKDIICPNHLLPMKLLPKPGSDGRLLTTYEYVCLGVNSEGRACNHKISLETFPQVSEALRRRDGVGIIH